MPFLASEGCFWPLTASITSEVKNNHAHVTTQRILNKFIGIKFSIGYVWFGHDAVLIKIRLPCLLLIRFYNLKLQNRFYTSSLLNWVKRERLSPKERPFPTIKITQLLARDRQFREHLRFKAEYSYVNWDQFCFARTSWIHPNFYSLTLYSLDSIHCAIYVVYNNVYVCM